MTEPVAWMWKTAGGNVLGFQEYKEDIPYPGYVTPLYTAEDLYPRVKMTQAEFDEFEQIFRVEDYASLAIATIERVDITFNNLKSRIFSGSIDNRVKNENEFNVLWANYNPDNPEETIEIVPNMKWFVVVTNPIIHAGYTYLSVDGIKRISYDAPKSEAKKFDTKEEAEEWKNPLTEAVLLPIE